MNIPDNLHFTPLFLTANSISPESFDRWLMHDGMLFNSRKKWWSSRRDRLTPHEGIDFVCYRDADGNIIRLTAGMAVPAFLEGTVAAIIPDYLGKTVLVIHPEITRGRMVFFTIFAHTVPDPRLRPGTAIDRENIVAFISDTGEKALNPHLHISTGWMDPDIIEKLRTWNDLIGWDSVEMTDPLQIAGEWERMEELLLRIP